MMCKIAVVLCCVLMNANEAIYTRCTLSQCPVKHVIMNRVHQNLLIEK
uniref:Uncharacterized protein n=1 Tax=Anguilla anguilla TaxID=7936 RepID=A0A0E9R284_ANGAN